MIQIRVELGDTLNRLNRIENGIKHTPKLYAMLGETLRKQHQKRFDEQRSPDGQAWTPLSPKYAKRKRANRHKILIREGYLKNTLRYQASSNEVRFGSDRIYARIHHFGGRHMPDRPWLGVSDADKRELMQKTERYIKQLIG